MVVIEEMEIFLCERVSRLRINKGVSARDMSLSIGQSAGYINQIENKKALPSMRGFFYICEYFDVSPKDFFDTKSNDPVKINEITADMKELDAVQLSNIGNIVKGLKK
jgi:transcriptional regulator with XRE-family HTH domain